MKLYAVFFKRGGLLKTRGGSRQVSHSPHPISTTEANLAFGTPAILSIGFNFRSAFLTELSNLGVIKDIYSRNRKVSISLFVLIVRMNSFHSFRSTHLPRKCCNKKILT